MAAASREGGTGPGVQVDSSVTSSSWPGCGADRPSPARTGPVRRGPAQSGPVRSGPVRSGDLGRSYPLQGVHTSKISPLTRLPPCPSLRSRARSSGLCSAWRCSSELSAATLPAIARSL